jgi:hypothetical protein
MALADDLKPSLRAIRGIPGALGLRPHRVFLTVRRWGGISGVSPKTIGDGASVDTETEIVEGGGHPPKVRQLNDERLALSGLPAGSIEIGPITASYELGDVTADALRGVELANLETLRLRVSGPTGNVLYKITKLTLDRSMHWTISAQPISDAST